MARIRIRMLRVMVVRVRVRMVRVRADQGGHGQDGQDQGA